MPAPVAYTRSPQLDIAAAVILNVARYTKNMPTPERSASREFKGQRPEQEKVKVKDRVLIVDDDSLIRELISLILRSAGYSVLTAENGEDALDKLKGTSVDTIVTDLRMPRMDGIEFTRELRMNPAYEDVPVIMLTSDFRGYKERAGEQAGVTDWISKPFIPQHLIQSIKKFQSERQTGELACSQA